MTCSWPSICGFPESVVPHLRIQPPVGHVALSCVCMCAQSCLTLCKLMAYSPPRSSVHGICQARIMEWADISFSSLWYLLLKKKKKPCISGLAQFKLVWMIVLNIFLIGELLYNVALVYAVQVWVSCKSTHLSSLLSSPSLSSSHPSAAAAKSLQSRPTLSDPTDGSPPGSSVHGILQGRVLEWGAIAVSASPRSSSSQCTRLRLSVI